MPRFNKLLKSVASSVFVVFLGSAAALSCWFLIQHIHNSPTIDYAAAGELLMVAVLAVEGIVAVHHLRHSRLDSVHQVLIDVMRDYRSGEMLHAINSLWRLRNEHGDRFVQVYLEQWRKDNDRIAKLPDEQQLAAMEATLHYRRRMVKEFFNLLAGLYELGVFPREILYTYWSDAELRIIPEILIPLETAVAKELRTETELGGWFQRLQRLYDGRRSGFFSTITAH